MRIMAAPEIILIIPISFNEDAHHSDFFLLIKMMRTTLTKFLYNLLWKTN